MTCHCQLYCEDTEISCVLLIIKKKKPHQKREAIKTRQSKLATPSLKRLPLKRRETTCDVTEHEGGRNRKGCKIK